jgi:hypothetical protein
VWASCALWRDYTQAVVTTFLLLPLLLRAAQAATLEALPDGAADARAAESALVAGDLEGAIAAAQRIPAGDAAWPQGRRLLVEAYRAEGEGRFKSAVRVAAARLQENPDADERAWLLVAIAGIYAEVDRPEVVEEYLVKVPVESRLYPQAAAIWAVADERYLDDPSVSLAWTSMLQGPLGDRWFEPLIPLVAGESYANLCRYEQAAHALLHARSQAATLLPLLDATLEATDAALLQRWNAGDWGDAGLGSWMAQDPDLALARARALGAGSDAAETALALAWLRLRLAEARARVAEVEPRAQALADTLATAPAEYPTRTGLGKPDVYPYRRQAIVWVEDPYEGSYNPWFRAPFRLRHFWWPRPTVSALSKARLYRYSGLDLCYDGAHPPPPRIDF